MLLSYNLSEFSVSTQTVPELPRQPMSDRDLSRPHSPVQAAFLREFQRCAKWRSRAVLLRRRVGLSGYSYGSTARLTNAKLNASFCGPRYHSLTQIAARAAQSADREPSASNQGYDEWRFRPRPDDPTTQVRHSRSATGEPGPDRRSSRTSLVSTRALLSNVDALGRRAQSR
jgi:hypothetical protein